MRPSPFGTVVALLILILTAFVSARSVGPVPALGPLLDPVRGVWANVRDETNVLGATIASRPYASASIPGLGGETRVLFDDRAVPHIFAPNRLDA
ncbi:MAG: hypothetical protein ABIW79_03210, partial [Gemmatimonas sp.]